MARIFRPTAALLLLSTGLFDFARGSCSAHGEKVFSDVDLEVFQGKIEEIRAQHTLKGKYLPSTASAGVNTTTTTGLPTSDQVHVAVPGDSLKLLMKMVQAPVGNTRSLLEARAQQTLKHQYLPSAFSAGITTTTTTGLAPSGDQVHPDVSGVNLTPLSTIVQASAITGNSRHLQEGSDCADGTTPVLVSSTVFPLLEGCLSPSLVDGVLWYTTDTGVILPLESSNTADPPLWFAYYQSSSDELTRACVSGESANDVDPSEATWYCDTVGDGATFTLADDELSVSCGCTIASASSIATPAPVPSTASEPSSCAEGDSFSVASDDFPAAEGCFLNTAEVNNDQAIYTTTGTVDVGQAWMFAVELTVDNTTSLVVWGLVNMVSTTSNDLNELYCISEAEASFYHPSDVPVWQCDIDGDGVRETIGDVLSISCGCSIDRASPPSPTMMITSAPAPSATAVPEACGEGDSFSISSETLPDAEGCYLDTGAETSNQKRIYTTSGTPEFGQIWMVAVDATADAPSTAAELVWALVYAAATDGSEDTLFYCVSEEDGTFLHPSEVQAWTCGEGIAIAVECGCSGAPPTTPLPTAQPATTPVGPPTAQTPPGPGTTPTPSPATGGETQFIASTCPGDKSFTITANAAPELDGCYTGSTTTDDFFVYTVSGSTNKSEIVVVDLENEDGDFNWYIAYLSSSDEDSRLYCISAEMASDANPGEASWICDFTGTAGNFSTATEEDISIVCGSCSSAAALSTGTSQPAASPVSSPPVPSPTPSLSASPTAAQPAPVSPIAETQRPVASPSARGTTEPASTSAPSSAPAGGPTSSSETCSGDGSFTITASAAPNLDGCFEDAGVTTGDGSVFYTVARVTAGNAEVVVFSGENDNGDFLWSIIDNSSGDSQTYCVSEEPASDVNPANASWSCDFSGDGDNFQRATEEELSVVCGPCATAVPDDTTQDASAASSLTAAVFTAGGGAGMVVAFASSYYAGWC